MTRKPRLTIRDQKADARSRAPNDMVSTGKQGGVLIVLVCGLLANSGCLSGEHAMLRSGSPLCSVEFRVSEDALYMPLLIPAQHSRRCTVYHHPVCGVHIEHLEADGVALPRRECHTDFDAFDFATLAATSEWHVYQVVMRHHRRENAFRFLAVSRMTDDDLDLVEYCVPINTTAIKVRYRPRYPEDELGEPITALAYRNEFPP